MAGTRARGYQKGRERERVLIKTSFCIYCGELAQTIEHFPPFSVSFKGFRLSACADCNHIAESYFAIDFIGREKHIKDHLKKELYKLNKIPNWTKKELEQVGENLRRDIEACQNKKEILNKRLAWNALKTLRSIATTSDFVRASVTTNGIAVKERG